MSRVYVVVLDKGCEYGAPEAVCSTKELAEAHVKEALEFEQIKPSSYQGYFILPFDIDDGTGRQSGAVKISKNGDRKEF